MRDESSNSFALFVVMLPVIMGAFGMGLDMSRNIFIRTELQNALDMAAVGGAGVTTFHEETGALVIDRTQAVNEIEKLYALNRANASKLDCWGDKMPVPGIDLKRCWKPHTTSIGPRGVTVAVRERSQNAFLTVIGLKWQEYTIESSAIINQQAQ